MSGPLGRVEGPSGAATIWAPWLSAGVAVVIAFIWLRLRLSPGVAFGPWQGPMLDPDCVERVPLLSRWISVLAPAHLNLMSAVFGALSCGALAVTVVVVAKRYVSSAQAMVCGVAAALMFAATPVVTYAGTAAGPSTLSAFLALAAVCASIAPGDRVERCGLPYIAALLAGLAACNHAALGLLSGFIVLTLLLFGSMTRRTMFVAVATLAVFMGAACVPLVCALAMGESLREFLSHALTQPYPNLFDGRPSLAAMVDVYGNLPVAASLAAVPGVVFLWRRESRHYAVFFVLLALSMGPLLPALTNQTGHGYGLRDDDTPLMIVVAVACLFAAWGMVNVAHLVVRNPRRSLARAALAACLTGAVLGLEWRVAPRRDHSLGETLGERILAGCPEDTLLVSGDPWLSSLVKSTQVLCGRRTDVTVLPAGCLARSSWERNGLRTRLAGEAAVGPVFPPGDVEETWPREQPFLFARFLTEQGNSPPENGSLVDFALWEFIKDNYERRPLCFVGLTSSWLAARAQVSGLILLYPRLYDAVSVEPDAEIVKIVTNPNSPCADPGVVRTLTALPLSLAETARNQGRCEESLRLGQIAAALSPEASAPHLVLARAEARRGQSEAALKHLADYVRIAPRRPGSDEALRRLIEQDLWCHAREQGFQALLEREREGTPDFEARQEAASRLWEADDLMVLVRGYAYVLAAFPDDLDALYQLAAAYTQLGDLAQARETLGHWMKASGAPAGVVADRLRDDGRFVLLRGYHSGE